VEAQAANGWSVQEMFAKNEQFGVKTSYDPNMAGYTVQLNREKMDSNEYRSVFSTIRVSNLCGSGNVHIALT
jgi:hypothetical protein